MKNKTQILIVHGGMTFKNQRDYLCYLKNVTFPTLKKLQLHTI